MNETTELKVIQDLLANSKTFREAWVAMEASTEDTTYHAGETTADHTRKVVEAFQSLVSGMPEADRLLFDLLGALHDIGKPVVRSTAKGRVTFYGHQHESVKIARKVLEEITYDKSALLLNLIERHMDIFQSFHSGSVKFLTKEPRYAIIDKLAVMAKADLIAMDRPDPEKVDDVVKRTHEARKAQALQTVQKREPRNVEAFVDMLKVNGLDDEKIKEIVKQRYGFN